MVSPPPPPPRAHPLYFIGGTGLLGIALGMAVTLALTDRLGGALIMGVLGWFGGQFFVHHCQILDLREYQRFLKHTQEERNDDNDDQPS